MTDLFPLATTADEQRRGAEVAVLPVGSFEQHGAHLPLATDTVIAATLAKAVAARVPRAPPAADHHLVLPRARGVAPAR